MTTAESWMFNNVEWTRFAKRVKALGCYLVGESQRRPEIGMGATKVYIRARNAGGQVLRTEHLLLDEDVMNTPEDRRLEELRGLLDIVHGLIKEWLDEGPTPKEIVIPNLRLKEGEAT